MKPAACLLLVFCGLPAVAQAQSRDLREASSFSAITEQAARSQALFTEAAKVLTSPRCMNCHPAGDHPTQGNDMHVHAPTADRKVGSCQTCHTDRNFTLHEAATYRSIRAIRAGASLRSKWRGRANQSAISAAN